MRPRSTPGRRSPRGLTNTAGNTLAGVYQHPSTDAQAGVSELALNFDYNANQLQWLLLAPGLINWVTQDTHLGLYRNYFGQDIDDMFIADNEWSSQFQCTPGGHRPARLHLPAAGRGQQPGRHAARCADERGRRGLRGQLGEADRNQAEPGVQRRRGLHRTDARPPSRVPTAPAASPTAAATYTDPGQAVDSTDSQRRRRSSTPCWPTRATSTGSPTPGRTCSWAAPSGSPRR